MVTSAHRSPVALILKVSKIALRRMIDNDLRNTAMQILYVQLTFPLFFLLLFYASRLSALVDLWLVFIAITDAFSWPLRWNEAHLQKLSADYFFAAV